MIYFRNNDNTLIHWGIKGQRWGLRRYRNEDGTLTEAGRERYNRELQKNLQKSKDKRANAEALNDPAKWRKDDLENRKNMLNASKQTVDALKDVERIESSFHTRNKSKNRLDLSNKTDKELRDEINRELLERQYNDVFNSKQTGRGRQMVRDVLESGGSLISLAAAATSVALGIHTLRHG